MSDQLRYDSRTIWLHWATAGLIVTLWGLAQIIDEFPSADRVWPRSLHIILGVTLLAIYITRAFWRLGRGRHLPPADSGVLALAAKAAHYGLYALVAATLGLGLVLAVARGDNMLNLFHVPKLIDADKALRGMLGEWHGTAANGILILAALHAAAALYHHFVLKDGVLRRML